MNIEIKDLKNVSERNCPFSNLKIFKSVQVDSLPKGTAEIETGMAERSSLGTRQNLVWFGEIERKFAKLSTPTFTYRSSSELFYGKHHRLNME